MPNKIIYFKICPNCDSDKVNYSEWVTVWSIDKYHNVRYYCQECKFSWMDKFDVSEE